jgi:hypothetical protein
VKVLAVAPLALAYLVMARTPAAAAWRPPDLRPTKATLTEVYDAYAKAAGTPEARFTQRRETWTYVNGTRRFPVRVAVRGDDFRVNVLLDKAEYSAGRAAGVRWRADANGITHATLADDQGDAVDRLPENLFPFARSNCELAGESERFAPAWVIADRSPRDKPHWFYVDKASGLIRHEITREGARTRIITFDAFEPAGGAVRPRRWHVADGERGRDLDVSVESIAPAALDPIDVAIPQTRRVFELSDPPENGIVPLPVHFRGRTIFVDADLGGRRAAFILDTGTASITLSSHLAGSVAGAVVLEHSTVPKMTIGPLAMRDVSTLAIPLDIGYGNLSGILGYDFFFGHVVHIDYENERVDVLTPAAAERAFADPKTYVADAYYDEGLPLVHAAFGAVSGDRFALDTGSPHLLVLTPFAQRHAKEIAAHWSPSTFGGRRGRIAEEDYLEGSIVVSAREAAEFSLGPQRFTNVLVELEEANGRGNAIDVPLDGIIGTDQMRLFDWWFDYDNGRIALRRNGLR